MKPRTRLFLIAAGWIHPLNMFTLIALSILFSAQANAQCTLVITGKLPLRVRGGWEVVVKPKDYNEYQYDHEWNPGGKLPGWGGWPNLTEACADPVRRAENPRCVAPQIDRKWKLIEVD